MESSQLVRAGRREWLALTTLMLPTVVLSMDLTVLHLAAPSLSADLAPSGTQLLWILDIYGFMVAAFLLVMGPLGDRIGRRRLLLIGAATFGVASVLAAISKTPETLIAARALLGVAGATLMPSTLALLADLFKIPAQRTLAIALWMVAFTAGEAVGPLVGGAMLEFFWWGSVFLIAVPVMAALLLTAPFLLPGHSERLPGRFDLTSAGLLLASILPLVYAIKEIGLQGFQWSALMWLVAGLVVGLLFVRRQLRSADPLMDVRLFRLRAFGAGVATQTLAVAAMAGSQLLVMQYLQAVLGLTPLAAGLWTAPSIVLGVGATLLAPKAVKHVPASFAVAAGLAVAAVGATILATTAQQMSLAWTVTGFSVLYASVTPTLVLTTDLIVGSAPRTRAGMASSVAESGAEFGLAAGIAFIGTASLAVYRSRLLTDAPSEIGPRDLQQASETVGSAVTIAEDLPEDVGPHLLAAVRDSFASGVEVAATASAVILVAGAALALMLPRRSGDTRPAGNRT